MCERTIRPNDVLEGAFWPEPVRVLTVQPIGDHVQIEAVGTKTQRFYPRLVPQAQLDAVRVLPALQQEFSA
ncbi:MAG: hypothetical protein NZ741_10255, partial [Armatimonadetes bacterium]|nr:hypothetical protein [Armatimonadota bacterium]